MNGYDACVQAWLASSPEVVLEAAANHAVCLGVQCFEEEDGFGHLASPAVRTPSAAGCVVVSLLLFAAAAAAAAMRTMPGQKCYETTHARVVSSATTSSSSSSAESEERVGDRSE